MSTHIKKLLSLLMSVAMVISMMPNMVLFSSAAEITDEPVEGNESGVQEPETEISYYSGTPDWSWYEENKSTKKVTLMTADELRGLACVVNGRDHNGAAIKDSAGTAIKDVLKGWVITLGADMVFNQGEAEDQFKADLDAGKRYEWDPIGGVNSKKSYGRVSYFSGTLDGAGHYISGLYNVQGRDNGFMVYTMNATIQNLAIINSYFENTGNNTNPDGSVVSAIGNGQVLGTFAGRGYGITLQNLYTDAILVVSNTKDYHTGGIVGFAKSSLNYAVDNGVATIDSCIFAGTIKADTGTQGDLLGGIVGGNDNSYAVVTNNLFAGTIYTNDKSSVGGIIGRAGTGRATNNLDGAVKGTDYGTTVTNNLVAGSIIFSGSTTSGRGAVVGDAANSKYKINSSDSASTTVNAQKLISNNYYDKAYGLNCVATKTNTKEENNGAVAYEDMQGAGVLSGALKNLGSAWAETKYLPVPAGVKDIYLEHNPQGHDHVFSEEWASDASSHWHECTAEGCDGTVADLTAHVYTDTTDKSCNVCGYERTETAFGDTSWYWDGEPYEIDSVEDLYGFMQLVNNGFETFQDKTVYLTADITVNEGEAADWAESAPDLPWTPIGPDWNRGFRGTLDGQGHYISGLYFSRQTDSAFFLWAPNATIQNLAIINSYFKNKYDSKYGQGLATFVSRGYGVTLRNLYSDAILVNDSGANFAGTTSNGVTTNVKQSTWLTGGIVAFVNGGINYPNATDPKLNDTTIENCVFAGEIIDNTNGSGQYVGGIAAFDDKGGSTSVIQNCLFIGTIRSNDNRVGGIVGGLVGEGSAVINCISAGKLYCTVADTGTNDGTLKNTWGGIAGNVDNSVVISGCYFDPNAIDETDGEVPFTVKVNGIGTPEKVENISSNLKDVMGSIEGLGLTGWAAYGCDYPVPLSGGIKAVFEARNTLDTEHDYSGNEANCGYPQVCPDCGDELAPIVGEHVDENPKDHVCDTCGKTLGEHKDEIDGEHKCAYCGAAMEKIHVDGNQDNVCDDCGADLHIHNWELEWNKNEYEGWHNCTAEGCTIQDNTAKDGYHKHSFVPAEGGAECVTCGYKHSVSYYDGNIDTSWYDENQTEFVLYHANQLYGFAQLVNGGKNFSGKTVKLGVNMVINQGEAADWAENAEGLYGWTSIGAYSWTAGQFQGTFDGQYHSISGLYQLVTNSWGGGLFNSTINATIQNLALVNSYIKNTNTTNTGGHMGSICTRSQDTNFLNLYSDAILYSELAFKVGGITGTLQTVNDPILVENCVFAGSITTVKANKNRVAGIAGSIEADGTAENHVTIKNCLNLGSVVGDREVGGIVGNFKNYAVVENCVNAGKVTCNVSGFGGIVGWHNSKDLTIRNCFFLEGTTTVAMSGSKDSTFIENTNVKMVPMTDLIDDVSALGLTDWTAYVCDFPVPNAVKAFYEEYYQPKNDHADDIKDHICDNCGDKLNDHIGYEDDAVCDYCEKTIFALVNDLPFASLVEAIAAAKDGDTITLTADCELQDIVLTLDKDITIDFNGFTVTGKFNEVTTDEEYNGSLKAAVTQFVLVKNNASVTLKDSVGTGGLEAIAGAYGNLSNLIRVEAEGELFIESGNYKQDFSVVGAGMIDSRGDENITIYGGTFNLGNVGTQKNGSPWILNTAGQNTKSIIVKGGTFNADILHQFYPFEADMPKELALKKVDENTYTVVPAVAYVVEAEWSSNWYYNDVGYATLEEAIAACQGKQYKTYYGKVYDSNPDEIILLTDIALDEALVIPEGKSVVLDLNGFSIGQTIESTGEYAMITNNGKLAIKASGGGKIGLTDNASDVNWSVSIISNSGELVIDNGYLDYVGPVGGCAVFQTAGSVLIEGGKYEGRIFVQPNVEGASMVINGGKFYDEECNVFIDNQEFDVNFRANGGLFDTLIEVADVEKLLGCIARPGATVIGTDTDDRLFDDHVG